MNSPTNGAAVSRLLAPAALAALVLVAARDLADRAWAPAVAGAGLLAAGVLALAAFAARRRPGAVGAVCLLAALAIVWLPRESPLWPATISLLLAVAVVLVVAERFGPDSMADPASLIALAAAAQWIARGTPVWTAQVDGRALVELVALPAAAALAVAGLGRRAPAAAAPLAFAAFAAGPGWTPGAVAALALVVAVAFTRERWLWVAAPWLVAMPALGNEPAGVVVGLALATAAALVPPVAIARAGRGALAVAAFAALVVAAPPWSRGAPLATVARVIGASPSGGEIALRPESSVPLVAGGAPFSAPLAGAGARSVVVDSVLSDSLALPCGTVVARAVVEGSAGERVERALVVGRDSGEWAARRADVAPRLACAPPAPFALWLPRGGGFFAARYRTSVPIDGIEAPRRLVIERAPDLPAAVGVTLLRVEVER